MLLIPAHAKVNLCLAVRGRRGDGFHDIDSIAVTVDWHDLVGVELRRSQLTDVGLRVTGAGELSPGDDNLAVRAVHAVAARAGPLTASLWLDKRVPSRAGLGGGSADAAAVLRACAELLDDADDLDAEGLAGLAASLGSDVPMLLAGGAQRMRGRGDVLTALPAGPTLHLVVAVAGHSETAPTYAAVEPWDFEGSDRADSVAAALAAGELPRDHDLGSGLEAAACRVSAPLDERLTALRAAVPEVAWHLTGSGGAAFALASARVTALELAAAVRGELGMPARACRTV